MPVNPRFKSFLNDYGFALVAPLVALLVLALLEPTSWVQRLENLAISLRFRVRAPYDPPADPRLLFKPVSSHHSTSIVKMVFLSPLIQKAPATSAVNRLRVFGTLFQTCATLSTPPKWP